MRLDIDLRIEWPGGDQRERVSLTGRKTLVEVPAPDPIESISFDPDAGILFLQAKVVQASMQPPGPNRGY